VVSDLAVSAIRRRVVEAKALARLAHREPATHEPLDAGDEDFWAAVRGLPKRQAQVVALYYLEDFSVARIAELMALRGGNGQGASAQGAGDTRRASWRRRSGMTIETRARQAAGAVRSRTGTNTSTPDFPGFLRHAAAARRQRRAFAVSLALITLLAIVFPLSGLREDIFGQIAPIGPGRDHVETPAPAPDAPSEQGLSSRPGARPEARRASAPSGDSPSAQLSQPDDRRAATRGRILLASGPASDSGESEAGDLVYVINEDGSSRTRLAKGTRPDWSPDGARIAYVRYDQECVALSSASGEQVCAEIWVMNADASQQHKIGMGTSPDWSPDGTRIAFVVPRTEDGESHNYLHIMNADGSGVEPLRGAAGTVPNWSPDGTRIAFASEHQDSYGCTAIWIWEVDGPAVGNVQSPGCYNYFPDWSPDGTHLVFGSTRGYNTLDYGIYVARADGSGVRRLTPQWDGSEPRAALVPSWSADGKRIAYMFDADGSYYGQSDLYCRDRGGSWAWADKSKVADCRPPGPEPSEIYVMNGDGSGAQRITEGKLPDFSP